MNKLIKFLTATFLFFGAFGFAFAEDNAGQVQNVNANQNRVRVNVQNLKDKPMIRPMLSNRPMTMGVVTKIEDKNITIESNMVNPKDQDGNKKISFVVDATKATFYENKEVVDISKVALEDKIMVEGEIKEGNIIATRIHLGDFSAWKNQNIGILDATGEPLVVAKVREINTEQNTITVVNKKKESYTVSLAGAKIVKNGEEAGTSNISKNDIVLVQGEITDNNVDASTVSIQTKNNGEKVKILKRVGNFFSKIFGSKK